MNKYLRLFFVIIVFTALAYLFYDNLKRPTIAVIQSQVVVEKYSGMEEARKLYEQDVKVLNEKFNEQKNIFEIKKHLYDSIGSSLTPSKKQSILIELEEQRQKTYKLGEVLQDKAQQKESVLIDGIFQKINEYIENYGKVNNIDIIIGTNNSGNVLYADKSVDITEEIIKGINEEYLNGK
ncbi:MAG: OmpH family outer membrane protein [bacterium]|nr:OmpH family outer membrane protein [bacterium]